MSLINQMLKDLAKRTQPLPDSAAILSGLTSPNSTPNKTNRFYWLIAILFSLVCIIILALVTATHYQLSKSHPNVITPLTSLQSEIRTVKHSENLIDIKPQEEPALLTGITLETQKEDTHLRLLLNQHALYQISGNGKDNVTILLDHTRMQTNLPQINTMNSAIKTIQMAKLEGDKLKIIFKLKEGAELSHVEMNTSGKNKLPELQVDLQYKNMADNTIQETIVEEDINEEEEEHKSGTVKTVSDEPSIQDEYKRALTYSSQGNNEKAITLLMELTEKDPLLIEARKLLVTLLIAQGDLKKAQQIISEGLQNLPLNPTFMLLKAQILVDQGDIANALDLLNTSPPPMSIDPEYHAFIAALYQRLNKSNLAEKLYEQLLIRQPDNSVWWLGLGIAREGLNKNKKALEAYKKAGETGHLTPELRNYLETRINSLV